MKQIAMGCSVVVALVNIAVARSMFSLAQRVQSALATALDAAPPGTAFFVRFWWWPLIFSFLAVVMLALPWCRREDSRLLALLVALLVFEILVLTYVAVAFVVPLSHMPTTEMIQRGVLF